VNQYYEAEVVSEYVIKGNTAVLKCTIPSFVADFVRVEAWVAHDGTEYLPKDNFVVNQYYGADILMEYVIKGNAAVLKCSIPSFVADFVKVESWIDEDGNELVPTDNYGRKPQIVNQFYQTRVIDEFVLKGNAAILKCLLPSFVADFVTVDAWILDETLEINSSLDGNNLVVNQFYQTRVNDEFVLRGNAAILKCLLPSFVADFVLIDAWILDETLEIKSVIETEDKFVVNQYYEAQVYDVFVIKGNVAIFKCNIPSFVSDHVEITEWTDTEGGLYSPEDKFAQVYDVFVIKGNVAIFKCNIPSFVSDHVEITEWTDTEGGLYSPEDKFDGKYLVLPSGELHIREVGPEDGYKSYQCRTKHRLTGETRLSATKGRLVITEPVGSVAPKHNLILFRLFEPVGSVRPKVNMGDKFGFAVVNAEIGTGLNLMCPAQSFPIPVFRWYKFIEGTTRKQAVVLNERVKQVSGTLIIKDAAVEDSGKYLCVVNNSVGGESVETVLTVTAPLSARIDPQSQTIDFGRPAVFTCHFSGNPIKTISWMKDGKSIGHSDAILRIESVKKEDKGMYQCFIRNDQESAEASAELKLGGRFDPPPVGIPTPEISWELDEKKIVNNDRFQVGQYVTVNGDVVSYLNITAIHANDGGLYKCIASSKVGVATHSAKLNVFGLPYIRPMEKKAIVAGETLIVTCPVAGHPIDSIVWERDNRALPINRKQKVFPNGTLIIENVERNSDQATYTCVANNAEGYSARGALEVQVMGLYKCIASSKVGVATHSAKLNVFGLPYIRPMEKKAIVAGETLIVTCPVAGHPIDSIVWERDNRALPINRKQKVFPNGTLIIENVERNSDQATYTCVAKNAEGYSARGALEVQVMVLPQIVPFDFGDEVINMYDMVSATCTVNKGDPPIDITWKTSTGQKLTTNDGILISRTIPPHIMPFSFGDEPMNPGDSTAVNCMVTKGDLPLTFKWLLNSQEVVSGQGGVTIVRMSQRLSALSIDAISDRHRGTLKCIAQNWAGKTEAESELFVNVPPQIIPFTFGDEASNPGDSHAVHCTVTKGDVPIDIRWSLNGQPLVNSENVSPQILAFAFGDEASNPGESIGVQCMVTKGDLPVEIQWIHNVYLGVMVTKIGDRSSFLTIPAVTANNGGMYTCRAINSAGTYNHSSMLNDNANSGDSAGVTCIVTKGDSPINISWEFNDEYLSSGDAMNIIINRISAKSSSLTIDYVNGEHRGVYKCMAMNTAGKAEYSAVFDVNVLPNIHPFSFDGEANSGDSIQLTCHVSKGDLPLVIKWTHNGNPIYSHSGILANKIGDRISLLTISSVEATHSGIYTCIASNLAGKMNFSAELFVNVLPHISPFTFDEDIFNGDSVQVTCHVTKGDKPLNISWKFMKEELRPSLGINTINLGDKTSMLIISSVSAGHMGEYQCLAENGAGIVEHSAQLNVHVLPKITPFIFGDDPPFVGDLVTVQCAVGSGDMPLKITWLHNGKLLDAAMGGVTIQRQGRRESEKEKRECEVNLSLDFHVDSLFHSFAHKVPPQILPFSFGDEPANSGDSAGVTCIVTKGDSPINISWEFNDEYLSSGDAMNIIINRISAKSSSLTIDYVNGEHRGVYKCMAMNTAGKAEYSAVFDVNVLPNIHPFSFDGEANSGDSIQLTCHVSKGDLPLVTCHVTKGDKPLNISWKFMKEELRPSLGINTINLGDKTSMLIISSVSAGHMGEYQCLAENGAGIVEHSAQLNVHDNMAPQWEATGCCDGGVTIQRQGRRVSVLTIEAVSAEHIGNYTCLVENHAGIVNHTANLSVNVPPKIAPFDFGDEPLNFGEPASVQCTILGGDLPINVTWLLNNKSVDIFADISVAKIGKRVNVLTIEAVTGHHAGLYSCYATNRAGATDYSAQLAVNVPPRITPFSFGDETMNFGEPVSVQCTISGGDLPVSVTWKFNGEDLQPYLEILTESRGQRMHNLMIDSVSAKHSGNYTCQAVNNAGSVAHTSVLRVNGYYKKSI
uniref:Ig-like domain-containing protein n=1 Tax=Lutzomyia longipalpis TaxID=7200 RepID=A0A1B0GLK3_LUTLO